MRWTEKLFEWLLAPADIKLNGNRPWDIRVSNPRTLSRILTGGSLGLGETYMTGWWECDRLDEFFYRIFRAKINRYGWLNPFAIKDYLKSFFVPAGRRDAFKIAEAHYN